MNCDSFTRFPDRYYKDVFFDSRKSRISGHDWLRCPNRTWSAINRSVTIRNRKYMFFAIDIDVQIFLWQHLSKKLHLFWSVLVDKTLILLWMDHFVRKSLKNTICFTEKCFDMTIWSAQFVLKVSEIERIRFFQSILMSIFFSESIWWKS